MRSNIDIMKQVLRRQRLEREQAIGKPRAKSWGGKPSNKALRREGKRQTRDLG